MYNIEKLNDTNYDSWSFTMKAVLVHQECWNIVSGGTPKPETSDEAWKAKDEKAMASIVLSITPMQISYIKSCKTSSEAWNTLRDVHRPKGPVRKVTLFKQLIGMRMNENDSIQQHVCNFTSIVDKLAETGIELQEELFVIMLLASLPKSFENYVIALETRDDLPKLSALKIKLAEEGERRKSNEPSDAEGAVQVFMTHNNKKDRNKNPNVSSNNNDNTARYASRQKHNLKCYNCGRKGHFAAQCRDKKAEGKGNAHAYSVFAASNNNNIFNSSVWCVDSGASSHLCCERRLFESFEEHIEMISLAGENKIEAKGRGSVRIAECNVLLNDVLFVPELQCNFISVGKVAAKDIVKFNAREARILDSNGKTVLTAKKVGDLFLYASGKMNLFFMNESESLKWHYRYGHLNVASLRQLSDENLVHGMKLKFPNEINCAVCLKSKCTTKPFTHSQNRASNLLEIIHTDICGPVNKDSIGGARYILTFIDDRSRFVFVYFLKNKDETFEKFREFKTMVECQTGKKIKVLRSDNGTEFVNNNFDTYLKQHGIVRQLTVPYTPQQNGVAERFNRTLVEMARSMLVASNLDESLWAEAVNTAAYLRNRAPTRALDNSTPYEVWFNRKPVVKHLKIFGSTAIALNKKHHHKFRPKGIEYVIVGYSNTSKAYRLYDKSTRKIVISRDVNFIENITGKDFADISITRDVDLTSDISIKGDDMKDQLNIKSESEFESAEEDVNDPNDADCEAEEKNNSIGERIGRGRLRVLRSGKQYNVLNLMNAADINVPQTVDEALSCEYSQCWWDAMQEEYASLMNNNTWELSQLPQGQKIIGCKWVFALKKNSSGKIERFKARLVAKGYAQTYGINYTETFSPVVRYETIRMIIALAAEHNLHLHQMDVSTAYLNSDLTEDVYMAQPQCFIDRQRPNSVLKLKKALYGLKQSGREWHKTLDDILRGIGFHPCSSEPCLYQRKDQSSINLIAVYVDDLLIASSNLQELNEVKTHIASKVQVVDKGPASNFLSIEIERYGETGEIDIHQRKYISDLLHQYAMDECRPVSTPLETKFQIACSDENCKKVNPVEYQSLIGSLMYLAVCSRPDILHSVCKLSQKNTEPHQEHMTAARRILKYLNKTIDFKLRYKRTGEPIMCYVDADWGGDNESRKSYTGYVFILAGGVFSWESKKQPTVALSSTEAEYMALSSAAKEAIYLKKLLGEIQLHCPDKIMINGDNMGSLHLVKNPIFHNRTKHIDIKFHHVRDAYTNGHIDIKYCCSSNNIADILTKNLSKTCHLKFVRELGFIN